MSKKLKIYLVEDTETGLQLINTYFLSCRKPDKDETFEVLKEFEVEVIKGDKDELKELINKTGYFAL